MMLADHRRVLYELGEYTMPDGEMCAGFTALVHATNMDRAKVRRIVRHLARQGFAEYHRGLWTEDGAPAGAGYCITAAGRATLSTLSEAAP